eukprot:TRINITY_DN752_c0_g1_i1.p1 TRINITY_DN752_c0_g1~~TRINITY_DN752_c0_g1_i1.p1  ORF type:complete len:315 (-),score=90.65 TRINITY_DN752_c0_g1_i1:73-1017(-)
METAERAGSPLIIANDPDADRLAVAELVEEKGEKKWKIFNGNEIGILLASWSWEQYHKHNPKVDPGKCVVINSTVSSKMLKALANKEGLIYEETLTGFKWMGNRAHDWIQKGYHFIYAFEEAIGFLIGDLCLDKDGIRSGCAFAEFASSLYSKGMTCNAYLHSLYSKYGYFASKNHYFFCYEPVTLKKIFDRIRHFNSSTSPTSSTSSFSYPKQCGPYAIRHVRDLTVGYDDTSADLKPVLPVSSSTEMITFYFDNGGVCTLRGSGTEPKLKYYTELSGQSDSHSITSTLDDMVRHIIDNFLQPDQNDLVPPRD